MANEQRIMEAIIRIGGEMDKSVKQSMLKAGNAVTKLNKKFASFEKAALVAGAAVGAAFVGAAAAATKALYNLGDEFQQVENTIRIGTGATGKQLEELEESFNRVYATLPLSKDAVAAAIADINTLTGATGTALEEFTHRALDAADMLQVDAKGLYTAAAKSFNAFGVEAEDMADKLDYVWKVSQSTGTGMQELMDTVQKNQTTFRSLGYTYEESIALVGQMDKAGFEATDAMSALQKAVANMAKAGVKDMSKGLENAIKKIKDAKTETEAAELAIEAFGARGGAKMAKGIRDGTIAVDELVKAMEASPETIGKAADATDTISDKWAEFKHHIEVGLKPAAETLYNAFKQFLPVFDKLSQQALPLIQEQAEKLSVHIQKVADKLKDWASGMDAETIKAKISEIVEKVKNAYKWVVQNKEAILEVGKYALWAYGIFRSFAVIAGIITTISTVFGALKSAVLAVKGAVLVCKGAWAALKAAQIGAKIASVASTVATWAQVAATWALNAAMAVLTSPIFLVILAIAAVIAIGWLLYKNWDTICEYLKIAWEGVKNFFSAAVDWLSGVFSGFWEGLKSGFKTVFEALPGLLKTPINAVISLINGAIDAINKIGFTIPDWVPGMGGKSFSVNIPKLPMLAAGGFTNGVSIAGEAGTEAVISFDPAYRRQNQGYLMTAAEMLGMTAAPKASGNTYNLGGITFSPVIQTGDKADSGNVLQQLRACLPDLMDMIEEALREKEGHRYV